MRHLLLIFLLFLLCKGSFAQLYTFKNFGHKDGLTLADINCLYQTEDGLLWLGTDGAGLLTYNGYYFNDVLSNDINNDHHVTSIVEDNKTIYFTSRYRGLYSYKNEAFTEIVPSSLKSGEFVHVFGTENNLMVVTTNGIYKINGNKKEKLYTINDPTHSLRINNTITLKSGIILLTSKGSFHISTKLNRVSLLNHWLHVPAESASFIDFGFINGSSIYFYNKKMDKQLEVILNDQEAIFKLNISTIRSPLEKDQFIGAFFGHPKLNSSVFITSDNTIFTSGPKGYTKVVNNFDRSLEMCKSILIDRNGDYWINSSLKGLYKVSLEPFTRVQLHPVYTKSSINTIFKSSAREIVLSTMEGITYFGALNKSDDHFKDFPFRTNAVVEFESKLYLGTNQGIKVYDSRSAQFLNISIPEIGNENITFLFIEKGILWVGISGKGLSRYDLKNGLKKVQLNFDPQKYSHIYTAQVTDDGRFIYFGSNNGIIQYDRRKENFSFLKTLKSAGAYIGVSTKDVYGNLWFSADKALIGILKNGEQVILNDRKIFPSTLFYTLNSDNLGNLIVGTNKGITIISVNEFGGVVTYKSYQGTTGFDGYETHMRSQYQDNNSMFVGTVEGLFLINTSILQNIPAPDEPVIQIKTGINPIESENTFQFHFLVNNPKLKNIEYSYRIKGYQNKWSDFTNEKQLLLTDLPNGKYTLEVKATYDGNVFSDVAQLDFRVNLPFWKSKWFIFILLLILVTLNILLINKNRSFSSGDFFKTKDTSITLKLTPTIILFALLANTSTHLFAPIFDSSIKTNLGITLVTGFVLLMLYLSALTAKKNQRTSNYKILLESTFVLVLATNLYYCYSSDLQPFFILAIVLVYAISPFIFEQVKSLLIVSIIFILLSCLIVLNLDHTIYNGMLFLVAVIIASVLSLFSSYLRYDSMEKLIFISGVINKGNVQAIAFNSEGIITYVSENIVDAIDVTHESILGQHISSLNMHVPEEGDFRRVDLTQSFEDGKKYIVPMLSKNNDLRWFEWSCKVFNDNVKVILGQNITDRLELENTYELLVQNAEDLIYKCDINGNFNFLNDRCFEKLSYTKEEMIGRNSLEFIPDDYKTEVSDFYRKHFEDQKESSYLEFPIVTKKGSIIWVGQFVTTLYKTFDNKQVTGFLALARDITLKREQQEIIKQQRDDITSSINYAQKIQLNLLPNLTKFNASFNEVSIIYRPKDIVSGDFYWLERIDDLTILALADCTGHGVPGSFMTLLGFNLLNNIVLEQNIFNPGTILDELDKKLTSALPRENGEENMNDGMEITVCVINHKTGDLSFACAGSRFLAYESNSFTMYKGDSKHIGDKPVPEFKGYITHSMKFQQSSTLYFFTDGFQDQFGGVKNKKYSFRRMLELFESNIRLPLTEQHIMIEEEFEKWKSEYTQTDDITILAIRKLKPPLGLENRI